MNLSLRLIALGTLLSLAGCSSSSSSKQAATAPTPAPIVTQAVEPPPQVVDGSASDDQRTTIQKSNAQIYGAEHAIDPDVSSTQNQGIP
jgi:hypothetical protein